MKPFEIRLPNVDAIPLVCSIPHTGTYVPDNVTQRFASDWIRSLPMTDWHLHQLYDFLPELGATTIYATWSRFLGDLNRPPEPRALYPGRFETGIVTQKTFWGDVVWDDPPSEAEIAQWKAEAHAPYHAKLRDLLDSTIGKFGFAVLLDLHSVASRASELHGELEYDIYLGNRDETTCHEWLTACVQQSMEAEGLRVIRNHPYKGGYITDHYGQSDDIEALQIEMCQRVYMNEDEPGLAVSSERFSQAKQMLERILENIAADIAHR